MTRRDCVCEPGTPCLAHAPDRPVWVRGPLRYIWRAWIYVTWKPA